MDNQWKPYSPKHCIPCNIICWCCDRTVYRCMHGEVCYKRENMNGTQWICKHCLDCKEWGECKQKCEEE